VSCPTHIVGFDDTPFPKGHRGDVTVVGAIYTAARLDGVLCTRIRRDGANATERLIGAVQGSRFHCHLQLIMLQGIALAGFNVVDIHRLHQALNLPVLVVCRKRPDLDAIRRALLEKVKGGRRKWRLIRKAGPVEAAGSVFIQRAGIDYATALAVVRNSAIYSNVPEPLRSAHIIANGISSQPGRQRV